MTIHLHQLLLENRSYLEDELFLRLIGLESLESRNTPEATLRHRVTRLVDAFLANFNESPRAFLAHMEKITEERISEGIALHQLQTILQVLEEKTWHLVVELVPQEDQVSCLGLTTLIIGTAKDHIAEIYLQHLERAEATVARWRGEHPGPDEVDLNCQRGTGPPHADHTAWTGHFSV